MEARVRDANRDVLSYSWAIVSAPAGSLAQLSNSTAATSTLVPDVEGTYVLSLVVNDGSLDSLPSNVSLVAKAGAEVDDFVQTCMNAISAINGLDPSDFKNPNMRDVLTKKNRERHREIPRETLLCRVRQVSWRRCRQDGWMCGYR